MTPRLRMVCHMKMDGRDSRKGSDEDEFSIRRCAIEIDAESLLQICPGGTSVLATASTASLRLDGGLSAELSAWKQSRPVAAISN